jgi:hypothetical protein
MEDVVPLANDYVIVTDPRYPLLVKNRNNDSVLRLDNETESMTNVRKATINFVMFYE